MINNYNPLVSIVIPVYNGSNFMEEAIDSALNQTYNNIEIIVINDGSNDNGKTEKIALSYGDKIRYYSKENGGVATALNLGIDKMKGEYFSWLSHDDLFLPEKIEKQVEAIDLNNNKEIIVCGSSLIDKNRNSIPSARRYSSLGKVSGKEMFVNVFNHDKSLNGCALLIPKVSFEECGDFNISLKYTQDKECWARMMIKDYSFLFIDETMVCTRLHTEQSQYKLSHLYKKEFILYNRMLVDYIVAHAVDKEDYLKTMLKFNYYSKNSNGIKYIKQTTNMKSSLSCYLFYTKGAMFRIMRCFYHRLVKKKGFAS